MANVCQPKRKASSSKSCELSSRPSSPEMTTSHKKRRLFFTTKSANDSSRDSFSQYNYIPSDSEGSSDSEFEEHTYSRSAPHSNKINYYSRPKSKSDMSNHISQFGKITRPRPSTNDSNRSKCSTKNAVMARLNRLKKKKYIEDLEMKNAELEAENQMLKNMLDSRAKEVESLKRKALNLESVIRNKTEIGSLLKCVRENTDLEISSSLLRSPPNNSPITEVNVALPAEKLSSSDLHELEASPSEEEALVAAVLWGLALHTFCHSYKPRTSTS